MLARLTAENFLRFDDRIATLLTLPGGNEHEVTLRWRQLVDVAARAGEADEKSAPYIAALAVIRADAPSVPLAIRAAAARSIAGRPIPHSLVELFAADRLAVNAPLLAAAPGQIGLLRRLHVAADADSRRFLETLHPQLVSPDPAGPSLHDVVARVEAYKEVIADAQDGPPRPKREREAPALPPRPAPRPRPDSPAAAPAPTMTASNVITRPAPVVSDAKSVRELVHELRTPLNAIIGFAEIIDGEYLGPANKPYRTRAAEIVAQARILLGAIEDLDFAARLRSGSVADNAEPVAVSALLKELVTELRPQADRVGAAVELAQEQDVDAKIDRILAARLLRRLLSALLATSQPGEAIALKASTRNTAMRFIMRRPRALWGLSKDALFDPAFKLEGEGQALLGLGFSLRLVRGLARVAGGDLLIDAEAILLDLPILD
ncbi:histidine kinase dimerization/phospho-acceptor domain-containing protein [Sphingomicrobium flavum]|uniref:histidine kinase dimerization/phospho-acceptor domain-containing protein n=1 Tax=Sphingomicrobium flavum TaxID=1229164 RepID=UPI0021ADBFB6|nr:histidine kinase dimerization/phospho-acceptor domain-containing protein [Sphingomicrobium flavum]